MRHPAEIVKPRLDPARGAPAPTFLVNPSDVRAFLKHINEDHRHCPCYGLGVRCHITERKIARGLRSLASGGSVADALAAAGPFGIRGCVEVVQ